MPSQSAIGGTPRAKCCATASWPAARRLTPNPPERRSSSWSAASRRTAKPTSGGSSESGIRVPIVSPRRSPSRSTPTLAAPAGNRRISPRSSCPPTTAARLLIPARRVWRNTVCSPGPRCSPPGSVLSRAHIYRYGRSLRPPQGTSIAPRRRAVFRQTLLAKDPRVAQGVAPRLRPHTHAMGPIADRYPCEHVAVLCADRVDLCVVARRKPQHFAVGGDAAHVGAPADVPFGDQLSSGEVEHGNRAFVAVGDVEQLRVPAWIETVCTGAGVNEPEHVPARPVDLPDAVGRHVRDVEDLSVGRQLHVLRHSAGAR